MRKKNVIMRFSAVCLLMLGALAGMAQTTVTGTVKDAAGQPLDRVSITEKGTNNGTLSDAAGKFSLTLRGTNPTLRFAFVGYQTREMQVGSQKVLTMVLAEDLSDLGEVTVTAGRLPVRKLETTTAVEIINSKALKAIKPEGVSEAITSAPGLYVNQSQGRRGTIVTRGFPDGGNPLGGLDYTAILLDGIPSFGTTGRLPEAGFGFDLNVEKVEVVRGSAATLFGRASAAGAVNVISRTGGQKVSGTVKLTNYNNVFDDGNTQFNYRVDYNINGPLTSDKRVRFNLGGWFLDDKGFKNTGFNDHGYQFRGNFDFLMPNDGGNVRLYFLKSDYVFQNLTDVPADMNSMGLAGIYKNHTTMQNFGEFYNLRYTVYESGGGFATRRVTTNGTDSIYRSVRDQMNRNSYGKNQHVGTVMNFKLKGGWSLDEHFRYQALSSGTKYSFALPSYYLNNSMSRLLLDGDAEDEDLINELRLKRRIVGKNATHNLVLGHFFSTTNLRPTTYSFLHVMNPSDPTALKFAPLAPPFVNVPWSGTQAYPRGSITRRARYTEQVNSVFVGDEMKIKDKLTVNLGARYDWVWIGMQETKKPFDAALTRTAKHEDYSVSAGFNYLLKSNTALYGNFTRAFRAPDYTAYTSLEWVSFTNRAWLRAPNGIGENEHVYNFELGYRTGFGDFSVDVAGFHTQINNRLASIFQNGIVISVPFGKNRIVGGELSVNYNSSAIRGLSIRSNLTVQNPTFLEFKIPVGRGGVFGNAATALNVDPAGNLYGNKLIDEGGGNYSIDVKGNRLPGIPSVIWNSSVNYAHKYFGFDFSSNVNANRYADPTRILKYQDLLIMNAGAYVRIPFKSKKEIRLGAQAKNMANQMAIQNIAGLNASDATLGMKQKFPNWVGPGNVPIWGQGYVQLPRRWLLYLSYEF